MSNWWHSKLKNKEPNKGIFKNTTRISIELSNLCNYSKVHKKCPLHLHKEPRILPEKIFLQIIKTCKEYDFKGGIAFHCYNEPGIDPRLMMFIKITREALPKATIFIMTNGFYFDENLAEEYQKNGVDMLIISAYSPKEEQRFKDIKLRSKIPHFSISKLYQIKLDDRLTIYEREKIDCTKPCHAPLDEVIITNEGKVSLCCLEWKREHCFGNLHKQSMADILNSEKVQRTYKNLLSGKRTLDICKRCNCAR